MPQSPFDYPLISSLGQIIEVKSQRVVPDQGFSYIRDFLRDYSCAFPEHQGGSRLPCGVGPAGILGPSFPLEGSHLQQFVLHFLWRKKEFCLNIEIFRTIQINV